MNEPALQTPLSTRTGLVELLQTVKKDTMLEIAAKNNLTVKKSQTKAKIAAELAEQMPASFTRYLSYANQTCIQLLENLIGQNETISVETARDNGEALDSLMAYGYLYLDKNKQKNATPIVPDELSKTFIELKNNSSFIEEQRKNQLFCSYIIALLHLYGVYDLTQLVTVWNFHQKEAVTVAAAEEWLEKIEQQQTAFYFNSPLIIDSSFVDEKEAKLFYENLASRQVPYYMPSVDELAVYANHIIAIDSPNYLNIQQYIHAKNYDLFTERNIMDEISKAAVVGLKADKLYPKVAAAGLEFAVEEDVLAFVQLFKELAEQTRKWSFKGWNFVELNEFQEETKVKKQQPITVKKVGRNEPCPCGSGKKYKKCHGS